jgi:predicted DNA binding protein
MILIADISVPSDAFPLGRVLEEYPDLEIELERLVPLREAIIPLFWVSGGEDDSTASLVETTLEDDPLVESVRQLTAAEERTLFEVMWDSDVNGLIQAFIDTEAQLLQAKGTAQVWDFRLQFRSRDALVEFRKACEEKDISLTLRRLYNPSIPAENGRLTENQHEALMTAYERGYFEVPRGVSMSDLADQFGISDSAFSQRLRRGTSALIAEALADAPQGQG